MLSIEERIKLRDELIQEFLKLKIFRQNKKNCAINSRINFNNEINNLDKELKEKYELYLSEFRSKEEALYCLKCRDDFSNHTCIICKNICSFYQHNHRFEYKNTCGNKECFKKIFSDENIKRKKKETSLKRYGKECCLQNEEIQKKTKITNLQRYGHEYPMQNDDIRRKQQQTMDNLYGVKHALQFDKFKEDAKATNEKRYHTQYPIKLKQFKQKRIKTNIQLFGKEHPLQNEEILEKLRKTNQERYNCDYSFQNEEIRKKRKNTMLQLYGVEYGGQSKEFQEKAKQTNLERYGVENPFTSKEIQKKIKQTNLKKYNVEYVFQQNINNYNIYCNDDKFKEFIVNKYNEKGMFLTLTEIANIFNVNNRCIKDKIKKLNLLQYFYIQQSNLEINFEQFLKNNNIKHQKHNRNKLRTDTNNIREIDFFCEGLNIGFEINDIVSHNSLIHNNFYHKDPSYHYNKSLLAKKNNIRLIHIWEWEIRNNNEWDRLSKWILNLFNNSKIEVSNNYSIRLVDINKQIDFLNQYNLDGYKECDICLGIYYNDELLQIMSFIQNNNEYQLIQICTKFGYDINYKYLLDYFISKYNVKSIIAYCNLDKFTGNTYEQLGFKLLNYEKPQIIWCDKEMNHFLQNNIENKSYVPIYNCGQKKYILN